MIAVHPRWLWLGGAAVSAAAFPVAYLWPDRLTVEVTPLPLATKLSLPSPMPAAAALTAPVFTPGRLPSDLAALSQPPPAPEAGAPPLSQPPVLVGVAIRVRGGGVALVRAADGQTSMVKPGEVTDGWTLTGVGSGQATFERGNDRHTSTLDFSNKPATATAPSPTAAAAPEGQAATSTPSQGAQ